MPTTLLNIKNISEKYSVAQSSVVHVIKQHKLEAKQQLQFGKGVVRFYDPDEVHTAMQAFLDKMERMRAAKKAKEDAAKGVSVLDALNAAEQLERMSSVIIDLSNQITAQNKALLSHFDLHIEKLHNHIARLEAAVSAKTPVAQTISPATVVDNPPPAPTQPVTNVTAAAPAPVDTRRKTIIIGLPPKSKPLIEKEFNECFKLEFFDAEATTNNSLLKRVESGDAVFAMTAFLNHRGVERVFKTAGEKLVRVTGGVSSLRDKLTDYFAQQ